eukprot:SAG22_NODE_3199_length_1861_cov_1.425085_2_plen_192_part_00
METSIGLDACGAFGNSGGELVCDTPANAEGIPEGSYTGSCGGCTADGGSLTCTHCQATDGSQRESTLAVGSCAEGEVIGNADGALACEDPAAEPAAAAEDASGAGRRLEDLPAHEENVPHGSYKDSCGGCKVEDGVMACECLNGYGALQPSTLSLAELGGAGCASESGLENIDGAVKCMPASDEAAPKQDL